MMAAVVMAYDLGTSGCKASAYTEDGTSLGAVVEGYPTHYPRQGWHEQRPEDWWRAFCESTRKLLEKTRIKPASLAGVAISGHSLGTILLGTGNELLRPTVPLWSDRRAVAQTEAYFSKIDPSRWYKKTGNGFSTECYPMFKALWFAGNEPEYWGKTRKIIGTKDYVNYLLTGKILTDYSYASGSGFYNLEGRCYDADLLEASGLSASLWPEIAASTEVVGRVTHGATRQCGLPEGVPVCCGGVDNSCMALGAGNVKSGHAYLSLGSSAWIAVSSASPLLDEKAGLFVFDHVVPGLYTSATSIFAACSSLEWFLREVCPDIVQRAGQQGVNPYQTLTEMMLTASEPGARGVMFNPTLAGGAQGNPRSLMQGTFSGITLATSRADLIRAVFEGITMDLALRFGELEDLTDIDSRLFVVGGGSKNPVWMQLFADFFQTGIVKGIAGQDAGSLGAAALAAVGSGLWDGFDRITRINRVVEEYLPDPLRFESNQGLLDEFVDRFYTGTH